MTTTEFGGGGQISQHTCNQWKEENHEEQEEEHENNVMTRHQKMNITSVKMHEIWKSWNQ
jgi:hypothetical protein